MGDAGVFCPPCVDKMVRAPGVLHSVGRQDREKEGTWASEL